MTCCTTAIQQISFCSPYRESCLSNFNPQCGCGKQPTHESRVPSIYWPYPAGGPHMGKGTTCQTRQCPSPPHATLVSSQFNPYFLWWVDVHSLQCYHCCRQPQHSQPTLQPALQLNQGLGVSREFPIHPTPHIRVLGCRHCSQHCSVAPITEAMSKLPQP